MYQSSTSQKQSYSIPINVSPLAVSDSPVNCFPSFSYPDDSIASTYSTEEYAAYEYDYYFPVVRSNTPLPLAPPSASSLASALVGPDPEPELPSAVPSHPAVTSNARGSITSHDHNNSGPGKHTRFPPRDSVSITQGDQSLESEKHGSYVNSNSYQSDTSTLNPQNPMNSNSHGYSYPEQNQQEGYSNLDNQQQASFQFSPTSNTSFSTALPASSDYWTPNASNALNSGMFGFNGDATVLGSLATPSDTQQRTYNFESNYDPYSAGLEQNSGLVQPQNMGYSYVDNKWVGSHQPYDATMDYQNIENEIMLPTISSPTPGMRTSVEDIGNNQYAETTPNQTSSELRSVSSSSGISENRGRRNEPNTFERRQQQQWMRAPSNEGSLSVVPLRPQQSDFSPSSQLSGASSQGDQCPPRNSDRASSEHAPGKHRCPPGPLQGHHVEMAPPPVPARSSTSNHSRPQKRSSAVQRRHTTGNMTSADKQMSTVSGPDPSISAGSSHSSPESLVSDSQNQADSTKQSSPNIRISTLSLNDAMWSQSQQYNRTTLKDTYRLRHGSDPPADMKILEISALERSQRDDNYLLNLKKKGEKSPDVTSTSNSASLSRTQPIPQAGDLPASNSPSDPESMTDAEFFSQDFSPSSSWRPALSTREIEQQSISSGSSSASSSIDYVPSSETAMEGTSTNTEDDTLNTPLRSIGPSGVIPDPYNPPLHQSKFAKKVLSYIRHDGHLPGHISGEGGVCGSAYDGRSYIPDDAEPDETHLPPPPPGARSGDRIAHLLPHPLSTRSESWSMHNLILKPEHPLPTDNEKEGETTEEDKEPETAPQQQGGNVYGFVEGSHPPAMGYGPDYHKKATKIKIAVKGPPKLACLFCRNRKIACGVGEGEDKTCNQCKRRNLSCKFPTESRRGMRNKKQRSDTTTIGVEDMEADGNDLDRQEGPSSPTQKRKPGRPRKNKSGSGNTGAVAEPREREGTKRKGKDKEKPSSSKRLHRDDGIERRPQAGEDTTSNSSDPLASLAAEMHEHEARNKNPQSPSTSFYTSYDPSSSSGSNVIQEFSDAQYPELNSEVYGTSLRLAP